MKCNEIINETINNQHAILSILRDKALPFLRLMCNNENVRLYRGIDENFSVKIINTLSEKPIVNVSLFQASFNIFNEYLSKTFNLNLKSSSLTIP